MMLQHTLVLYRLYSTCLNCNWASWLHHSERTIMQTAVMLFEYRDRSRHCVCRLGHQRCSYRCIEGYRKQHSSAQTASTNAVRLCRYMHRNGQSGLFAGSHRTHPALSILHKSV